MPLTTVDQVNIHLSSPPWSADQRAACATLIGKREAELARWLGVPLEPILRVDTVPILLPSGLVATPMPIYRVLAIDGVDLVDNVLPVTYELRDEAWLYSVDPGYAGYSTRPFSLISGRGGCEQRRVSVKSLAGWGPKDDIIGAVIEKVGNTMLNRHDDTVVARNLDAQAPAPLKEEWTPVELLMLKSRKRPRGVNRW
ncbi:MAG TPA: hypothetical protein VE155_12660 [Pseudonocardiaceae bacterium]|nr:hypothetical protein [Pseudonocardiaceae bacterium]